MLNLYLRHIGAPKLTSLYRHVGWGMWVSSMGV